MPKRNLSVRELALCAALAAISAIAQLIHFGYQASFMWVDVVGTSWIIAFFLFGIRGALLTSLIGFIVITLFAPTTWIGASMKWIETLPMWLVPYFWLLLKKRTPAYYQEFINLIVPLIIALIMRSLLALPLNYYYAIPLYLGMSHGDAIGEVPWYLIVIFNIIQGSFDVIIAWFVVFRFKLMRFASWYK